MDTARADRARKTAEKAFAENFSEGKNKFPGEDDSFAHRYSN